MICGLLNPTSASSAIFRASALLGVSVTRSACLAMVASGQGVSLLQKMLSFGALEGLTTRALKESGPDLRIEARALWREGETSPLTRNFVDVLSVIKAGAC